MQIIFFISLLFVVAVQSVPHSFTINTQLNEEWVAYKFKFNKRYDSLNELTRRIIWEENLRYIQQHNLEYDLGKHSYNLGLNMFADMTHEEFRSRFLPNKLVLRNATGSTFIAPENIKSLPKSVDWRTQGYVTPVKDQQSCGSCWAFSTTGSLEGQHKRKTGILISLSEQQLVDCSQSFGNEGCGGGLMDQAFAYIKQFGIESEASYPYTADDGKCLYNKSKVVAKCTGFVDIPQNNENLLAASVATVGPISIGIDASQSSFQFYKSGIYNEPQCSSTSLDHGVLAVGYGTTNGKNFWIVKNSWGASWGMNGYIEMSKDNDNQCGVATAASYPLV